MEVLLMMMCICVSFLFDVHSLFYVPFLFYGYLIC